MIIVAAIVAAGCASAPPARWDKAGASATDYDRDAKACAEQAATATAETATAGKSSVRFVEQWRELLLFFRQSGRQSERDRVFVKCMETRGWRPVSQ